MSKIVRIGGACAFLGDSSVAAPQLLKDKNLDYMILDYLAEVTISHLARGLQKRADAGYARDFTDWIWKENLREFIGQDVKIVTNAGGLNPQGCRARMEKIAEEAGLKVRIAIVEGDDLRPRKEEFAKAREMFSGAAFPKPDDVLTVNAYLGAFPIAKALAEGADVVITGRVVDSALTLGPLIHEFGWKDTDYDRLSAGSLAGHVIECGAQATGGLFTDWEDVPDWAHIGYPVIECEADGAFTVTKPKDTGGLVVRGSVAEQILYEVGDPQAYMLPDVVCDFSELKVEETGKNRVRVSNAKGYPPTGNYKVCVTHKDGFRVINNMAVAGRDAGRKAQRQAEAVLERVEEMLRDRNLGPFRAKRIEILGTEASYGANARDLNPREVVCRFGVEHDLAEAIDVFQREISSPMTSMSVGAIGWFSARSEMAPVIRVFSFELPREAVAVAMEFNGKKSEIAPAKLARRYDSAATCRPQVADAPSFTPAKKVPLVELAYARSGDKGDSFNVGIVARKKEYLPYIRAALSEKVVGDYYAHEFEGAANPSIKRFDLPGFDAINFLMGEALGGGQMASLRLDPLAKAKAQQLLDFEIPVPAGLL